MATRRFTYGYGRAEDLAGVVIVLLTVLLTVASAGPAGYEAVKRLIDPQEVRALAWVAGAGGAALGFPITDPIV